MAKEFKKVRKRFFLKKMKVSKNKREGVYIISNSNNPQKLVITFHQAMLMVFMFLALILMSLMIGLVLQIYQFYGIGISEESRKKKESKETYFKVKKLYHIISKLVKENKLKKRVCFL